MDSYQKASFQELRDELLKDPAVLVGYQQGMVIKALHLLREAETTTHLNLPADFLGVIDAESNEGQSEAFQKALEAHKAKLRQEAIAILEKLAYE